MAQRGRHHHHHQDISRSSTVSHPRSHLAPARRLAQQRQTRTAGRSGQQTKLRLRAPALRGTAPARAVVVAHGRWWFRESSALGAQRSAPSSHPGPKLARRGRSALHRWRGDPERPGPRCHQSRAADPACRTPAPAQRQPQQLQGPRRETRETRWQTGWWCWWWRAPAPREDRGGPSLHRPRGRPAAGRMQGCTAWRAYIGASGRVRVRVRVTRFRAAAANCSLRRRAR